MPEPSYRMQCRPPPCFGERFRLRERHLTIGGIVQDEGAGAQRSHGGGAIDLANAHAGASLDLTDQSLVARLGEREQIGEAADEQPRLGDGREERG